MLSLACLPASSAQPKQLVKIFSAYLNLIFFFYHYKNNTSFLGSIILAHNPRTQNAEAGGSQVQIQPGQGPAVLPKQNQNVLENTMQWVECLPSISETPGYFSTTTHPQKNHL